MPCAILRSYFENQLVVLNLFTGFAGDQYSQTIYWELGMLIHLYS